MRSASLAASNGPPADEIQRARQFSFKWLPHRELLRWPCVHSRIQVCPKGKENGMKRLHVHVGVNDLKQASAFTQRCSAPNRPSSGMTTRNGSSMIRASISQSRRSRARRASTILASRPRAGRSWKTSASASLLRRCPRRRKKVLPAAMRRATSTGRSTPRASLGNPYTPWKRG